MLPNEKLKSSMSKIKVTRIFDAPKMLFSGILILALTAALVAVIPDSTKPVFADLSGLPSDTGFPCSADEGRGGIPYQFMWGTKSKSLLDKSIADAVRGGGGTSGIQWQVGGYNPSTEEYDVVGTWSPEVDGGLKDDNGSVLIAENTFAKKSSLEQVNGFAMDPLGNGYVAIQPSGGANTYYVQLIPDTDADGLGEMRAIAKLQDVDDINGGTYYEDSNGDPYAILSSNFLGKSFLVPLTRANNANIPDISYVDYDGDSNPKDYSWVKEEITYNGNQYNLVGLEQTSSTKGTIWLQHTEDKNRAVSYTHLTLPTILRV